MDQDRTELAMQTHAAEYWKMQYELACAQANRYREERDFFREMAEKLHKEIIETELEKPLDLDLDL